MAEQRTNPEDNQAQAQSDAPSNEVGSGSDKDYTGESDRAEGRGSDANGIPAFDEAAGEKRRKEYKEGADLVSRMD